MTGEGHTGEDVKKEKPSESLAGSSPPPLPSRLSAAFHLAENGSHCVTRTPILPDSEASMLNVRPVSPDFIFPLVPSLVSLDGVSSHLLPLRPLLDLFENSLLPQF